MFWFKAFGCNVSSFPELGAVHQLPQGISANELVVHMNQLAKAQIMRRPVHDATVSTTGAPAMFEKLLTSENLGIAIDWRQLKSQSDRSRQPVPINPMTSTSADVHFHPSSPS